MGPVRLSSILNLDQCDSSPILDASQAKFIAKQKAGLVVDAEFRDPEGNTILREPSSNSNMLLYDATKFDTLNSIGLGRRQNIDMKNILQSRAPGPASLPKESSVILPAETKYTKNETQANGEIKEIEVPAKNKNSTAEDSVPNPDRAISFKSLSPKFVLAAANNTKPENQEKKNGSEDETSKRTQNGRASDNKQGPNRVLTAAAQTARQNGTTASIKKTAPNGKSKISTDVILIVVTVGVILFVGIFGYACCYRNRKSRKHGDDDDDDDASGLQEPRPTYQSKQMPVFTTTFVSSPTESRNSTEHRIQNSTDPRIHKFTAPRRKPSGAPLGAYARSVGSGSSSTRSFPIVRAYPHDRQEPSRQDSRASFFSEDYDGYDDYAYGVDRRGDRSQSGRSDRKGSIRHQRYWE
ncbi:hypothetical protein CROQUDRAFT_380073 [Cronartium quercuum f. sp. fusiforme G11]|uniref:Uncharacterized protein n=1 Tax=Cronartium quercuum f. sp. fusiforme G11 TaxID=708437 RepID=A0A9P6TFJ8_9BASI|nr:hypothetical protein CROQUDRAFT_380073 [Cronartium quercuum f. sp. fusiforme G11]